MPLKKVLIFILFLMPPYHPWPCLPLISIYLQVKYHTIPLIGEELFQSDQGYENRYR